MENIIKYSKNKIEGLPASIVFSKSFLSFSRTKDEAEKFFDHLSDNKNYYKVLFILEKDYNSGYNLSTHGDLEKISYYEKEQEVLFFPFSSFEIKKIKDIDIKKEKENEIQLLYLGKYLEDVIKDSNIISEDKKLISDSNNKFNLNISEFGLIPKEKIEKSNTKEISNNFKKYEKEIKNVITADIHISPDDLIEYVQIINSFENVKRANLYKDKEDDSKYENEKELQENVEIKINGEKIDFCYLHYFEEPGMHKIEYSFKNNLTKANHMFSGCTFLTNLNLSNFNTQYITNMCAMFNDCISLTNINLSNFNTQNVFDMSNLFNNCGSLTSLDLSNFNAMNVINMNHMFNNCSSLVELNLTNFYTQNVTNMFGMFSGCNLLTHLDLSNFYTQNVTDMSYMFYFCYSLVDLNLSNFITQNVTNMSCMFNHCRSLTKINLSNFYTQNVTDMSCMFSECISLNEIDLSNCNTKNVRDMRNMFSECASLTKLDLSSFNTQNVINMNDMFYGCRLLAFLNLKNFDTKNVVNMVNMFNLCEFLMKENLITYDKKISEEFDKTINSFKNNN